VIVQQVLKEVTCSNGTHFAVHVVFSDKTLTEFFCGVHNNILDIDL